MHQPQRYAAAVVFLVVVAYATVAALQILVWNPLAAVPGMTLGQIRHAMEEANEALHIAPVIIVLGLGVLLTAVLVTWMVRAGGAAVHVVLLGLALVACGAPAYFVASFNAGMSLADAFAISGADVAPWGGVLLQISLVAFVAFWLVLLWRAGVKAARRRSVRG
ncbi:hypothetical protein GCM10010977_25440 [Citricoccus zhacaiensis]|uniref:DUF1772 domain-containing protein n=1 Tax=Citricoccus zhacaiensis TaxID=489142 RepID=A0ABQ2M742_9MICC|nr:hypothetical protein [Citricoccus zhacaiensis]GGO47663.1 hypothetical protein GCM10010977_25440 [Citricoccus zhacaiensis]